MNSKVLKLNTLLATKLVIVVVVAVLFILTALCGHVQISKNLPGAGGVECNNIFLSHYIPTKAKAVFSVLLLFFVALALLERSRFFHRYQAGDTFLPSIFFFKASRFIFKLFYSILVAFRRGILHPQVYILVPSQ